MSIVSFQLRGTSGLQPHSGSPPIPYVTYAWVLPPSSIYFATAPENDEQNPQKSIVSAMSDVETVPSLPATLDAGQSALAVKVNHQSPSGPPSPRRVSLPPIPRGNNGPSKESAPAVEEGDGPASPKADSEAETIIQSGRESLSPEKRRKYIQHEPKRRNDGHDLVDSDLPPNDLHVRKRNSPNGELHNERDRADARLSNLHRRTESPPSIVKVEKPEEPQAVPPKVDLPKAFSAPRPPRKRSFSESVDGEGENGRSMRQSSSAAPRPRERKDLNGIVFPRPVSHDRSASPTRSSHKRSASGTQLSAGDLQRKKKAPTPLMTGFARQSSEDRQSVSSSTSGSPLPSAYARKLGSVDGASASPARPMGHKKQRDQNGRTRLARACAAQELEVAIARHADRPEDLNVADNAGNTPLQIASLEGCAPIVKFLLEAGCEIDTKNIDKDTPLIDAVENGHLDVVRLLLAAGANPRTLNAEGDEPYELVPSDSEEYDEIRRVIAGAKANHRPNRRSEERAGSEIKEPSSRRISAESARESPPVHRQRSPISTTTKRKTVRSEATRNDLLWTTANSENLQAFAAKGDMVGVANILNVGQKSDTESMIAAAKGGHDEVMSLLLGIGDANPDPDPIYGGSQKPGYNTPMLAAIGRGNPAAVHILLDQPQFNPTRRPYKDRTYYELSRERKGDKWEEEYDMLREAYDSAMRNKKPRKQEIASPRRPRDRDKENRRPGRRDSASPVARPRKPVEPRDGPRDASLPKERKRESVAHVKDKPTPRPKLSHAGSDPDGTRVESTKLKAPLSARDGDSSGPSRGEDAPKRRRLIAGRPPQDRERRRPSLPSSDSLSGRDEGYKPRVDPAEPSKPGLTALKRGRSSASPERARVTDPDRQARELQKKKKRRVLSEEGTTNITNGGVKKHSEDIKPAASREDDRRSEPRAAAMANSNGIDRVTERKPVKEEQEKHEVNDLDDIPMEDAPSASQKAEAEAQERRQKEAQQAEKERQAEEARIAAEAEKARAEKEEEERVARAARLAQEKAAEEERKRKEAEQRRIKQAEDERQKRLEQERLRLAKLRREQEEQEQRRRDALPSRLRIAANLVGSNDPLARSHLWLKKFMPVVTAETRQLDPRCSPDVADEKWVPNYLVAPILATNDLQLSQYASWEKRDATQTQRVNLWRVTRRMLVQADDREFMSSSFGQVMQKDNETRPKYFDMEHVFWVKLSDFMDLVPHIPHLHGLDLQFLKMHIDEEPTAPSAFEMPQANGHLSGPPPLEEPAGFPGGLKGLTNGFGHRPSTYV
ncbi:Set3 complex subunit [Aspergillus nanangensis]|uniref:Set3 complex subunit n=1 Tax=Aspergillus nanangensis TaxID=2582783 RepID=A0AAD4H151_ASPNN|nr:Set3 complex subunit [Aspergillus nanangensis]